MIGTHGATGQQVSFSIGPVNFYDNGDYKCKATNKHGADEMVLSLNISSKCKVNPWAANNKTGSWSKAHNDIDDMFFRKDVFDAFCRGQNILQNNG